MHKIIFFFCLLFTNVLIAVAGNGVEISDIFADEIRYERKQGRIFAKGNVEIYFEGVRISANIIEYDRKNNTIYAWGDIHFTKEEYSLTAAKLIYNVATSTGVVYNVRINATPIYVCADKIFIKADGEFFIPAGDITTCNYIPPCYMFRGRSIHLKLDSWIRSLHTFLLIRNIPVFYYPSFFKNLGPERLKTDINVGQSNRDGFFLRSKFSYPFTEHSRSYIGADFLTKRGIGLKAGHTYRTSTGFSDLNIYYLRELHPPKNNLNLDIKGWQKIYKNLIFRYRVEYTSDFDFAYNHLMKEYRRRNIYQFGFDWMQQDYIISLYANKKETWKDEQYIISDFILPGASFKLLPVKLPGRINFSANIDYKNLYISYDNWQSTLNWYSRLRGSYRLNITNSYSITLSPGIKYEGVWKDSLGYNDYLNFFTGLNQGIFNILFLNNKYTVRTSLQYPYNITKNFLESELLFQPFRQAKLSIKSSYGFRDNISEPVSDFFSYAKIDFSGYDMFIRHRYDFHKNQTTEWLYELNIDNFSRTRIKYNYLSPGLIDIGQNFTFNINPLKINIGTRFHLKDYKFDEFIEQSISIDWDMHCWQSQIKLLRRREDIQFWVLFNLTAFPDRKIGIYGNPRLNDYRFLKK